MIIFKGDYCEIDRDGCADGPCQDLQDCFDNTPEEEQATDKGFTCSACPDGYKDGLVCEG